VGSVLKRGGEESGKTSEQNSMDGHGHKRVSKPILPEAQHQRRAREGVIGKGEGFSE